MAIVTQDECKDWLKITAALTAGQEFALERIRLAAEKAARRYVGSSIEQATYTHILPNGLERTSDVLRLPEFPVRSITTVHLDLKAYHGQATNAFAASTLLTAGTHYYLRTDYTGLALMGHLVRIGGFYGSGLRPSWPRESGTVKVVYVAGWSADELAGDVASNYLDASQIKDAVLATVADYWHELQNQQTSLHPGDVVTESLEGWSETKLTTPTEKPMTAQLSDKAKDMLAPFRRAAI